MGQSVCGQAAGYLSGMTKNPKPLDNRSPQPTINLRRLRAALDLRGITFGALAREARVCSRHLRFVVLGERRTTSKVMTVIRAALGEAGWAFATGQTDLLRDEGGSDGQA